jgi:hypothetical protein
LENGHAGFRVSPEGGGADKVEQAKQDEEWLIADLIDSMPSVSAKISTPRLAAVPDIPVWWSRPDPAGTDGPG